MYFYSREVMSMISINTSVTKLADKQFSEVIKNLPQRHATVYIYIIVS